MDSERNEQKLRQAVQTRWAELAAFAVENDAAGYNRGYVLLSAEGAPPRFVPVPDGPLLSGDLVPPLSLEQAVLCPENGDRYIVVALRDGPLFSWGLFPADDRSPLHEDRTPSL